MPRSTRTSGSLASSRRASFPSACTCGSRTFAAKSWPPAERRFREVLEKYPESDAAPEALYWAGVARYRTTGDAAALAETAAAFATRYSGSLWAKKASIWKS